MKIEFDNEAAGTELALISNPREPVSIGQSIAVFVKNELATIDAVQAARFGFALAKTIRVDGRRDLALHQVKPHGGEIEAEWASMIPVLLLWIAKTLDERSPVVSGDYQRGHVVLADGVAFDVAGEIPPASEYTFLNTVPYARRLEIGKTRSGDAFVLQVPSRIYERTADDARSRFGNVAKISSAFVEPTGAYTLRQNQAYRSFKSGKRRVSRRQRPDRAQGNAVTVPAIIVKVA